MELTFELEKPTTNALKFKEVPEAGQPPKVGTLYVQKWAFGDAKKLTVTIEVAD